MIYCVFFSLLLPLLIILLPFDPHFAQGCLCEGENGRGREILINRSWHDMSSLKQVK